ncbi:hypothetical protein I3I95_01290 [bacterium]|nr:hypothetical protein [bacterium]
MSAAAPQAAPQAAPPAGAAALVNGEPLPLATLVARVEAQRARVGSPTDAAWEAFLADQGTTPDGYWRALIDHYGREMAVSQRCAALGIRADPDEVARRMRDLRGRVGAQDERTAFLWDAYLRRRGVTEQSLRAEQAWRAMRDELLAREVPRRRAPDEMVARYLGERLARPTAADVPPLGADGPAEGATVDLRGVDPDLLDAARRACDELVRAQDCDLYVRRLYARAHVRVLVPHFYDVPGQRHGAPG